MRKTTLYNHFIALLCKKRLAKAPIIREMTSFGKVAKLAMKQRLQALQNGQFGTKTKIAKSMQEKTLQPF